MTKNNSKYIKLAIDTYGADNGEFVIINGCDIISKNLDIFFIFIGNKKVIDPLIKKTKNIKYYSIINTLNYVKADEKGSDAIRSGKNTSMRMAIDLVKNGKADAVISAGNTGALLSIAYILLRTIEGITRPAMTAYFPTKNGETAMLDLGANIEGDSKNLIDFALMGSAFSRIVLKSNNPSVGLLNVGVEAQKGNTVLQEAASYFTNTDNKINYFGFVEGDGIAEGVVDVIVTDGFSGNIALKTAEGTSKFVTTLLEKSFRSSIFSKLGYLLAKNGLRKMKNRVNPSKYNGAVLLGLNGIVVKSHGNTDSEGFSNAVKVGYGMVKGNFISDLKNQISF